MLPELLNGDDDGALPTQPGQFALAAALDGIELAVAAVPLVGAVAEALDVVCEGPQFTHVKESVRPV